MAVGEQIGKVVAVDHVGYVVSDLDRAVGFFIDYLGFQDLERRDTLKDELGEAMLRRFDVDRAAVGRYAFVGVGDDKVELLEWSAPERVETAPRNSDAGGRHLALAVVEMDALLGRLSDVDGIEIREPNERGFVYVSTPFGLEIQLVPVKG